LDTVLTIRDAGGKRLAENDDVVGGQGSLIGNPDSSLFYTPQADGPLYVEVSDRTRRGGAGFVYRLKVKSESPGFQLFTTPENAAAAAGGSGEIKVHLVREADFKEEVSIWFEGLPEGMTAPSGKFRADQLFEPNADGADMIIPEITFSLHSDSRLRPGTYPIRVMGCATPDLDRPGRTVVEAHAAVMIGPLLDIWNYSRRPLPGITMTVVKPFEGNLSAKNRSLTIEAGGTSALELKLESIPEDAPLAIVDLPEGIGYRVASRTREEAVVELSVVKEMKPGSFEIAAEAAVGKRRVVAPVALKVQAGRDSGSR
jgi:hypothetical protein